MGFCKENEICKPFVCRKALCPVGDRLRNLPNFRCGGTCSWIEQGIDAINSCKDAFCPTGNVIVEFRKQLIKAKH